MNRETREEEKREEKLEEKREEKREDRLASVAKKIEEEKADSEARQTLFAAKGKPTVPAKAPVADDKYRDDVLRRVNRRSSEEMHKAKSIVEQGHVFTVTMPNGLRVRLTLDDNLNPIPETITREHIVRWEAVA